MNRIELKIAEERDIDKLKVLTDSMLEPTGLGTATKAKIRNLVISPKTLVLLAWDGDELAGAIVVTISKRKPLVANLQLLHTFYKFRGRGVGSLLCDYALQHAYDNKAEYFRVSAELDAVPFYEKYGFKMICRQKTAQLAMFSLIRPNILENDMEYVDLYIWKQMNRKGKGGCIECFVEYKSVDKF